MKAPKEYKNWINKLKKVYAKPNGVLCPFILDYPKMEDKLSTSKKNYMRNKNEPY